MHGETLKLKQLSCHPVAAVQYTFIHKQHTEQHI